MNDFTKAGRAGAFGCQWVDLPFMSSVLGSTSLLHGPAPTPMLGKEARLMHCPGAIMRPAQLVGTWSSLLSSSVTTTAA